jgi:release factor glutamine methyltransferase
MTLQTCVREARGRLIAAGVAPDEAVLDAELLARHVLGWDRATLLARAQDEPPAAFAAAYAALLERRVRREPMAYITGHQEFWGRDFLVGPGVLIPRPETELLIEEALAWARTWQGDRPPRIVDVGTGSGCLAVTLALELPRATVYATDISDEALAVARRNASRLGAQVGFHAGSVLAGVPRPVDLIVANPPYVARAEYETLQPEVRVFEPMTALVGGDDGLDAVRLVVKAAAAALAPGGGLLMEIGYGQADVVARLVASEGALELLCIRADLQGTPRAVVAARGPMPPSSSASE